MTHNDQKAAPMEEQLRKLEHLTLIDVLRDQRQCDEDGVMCIVSRQAVDEAISLLSAPQAPKAGAVGEVGTVCLITNSYGHGRFVELQVQTDGGPSFAIGDKLYTHPAAEAVADRDWVDAERYQWLVERGFVFRGCESVVDGYVQGEWLYRNHGANEAIDAARHQEAGRG